MTVIHITEYFEFIGGLKTHIQKLKRALELQNINSVIVALTRTMDNCGIKKLMYCG